MDQHAVGKMATLAGWPRDAKGKQARMTREARMMGEVVVAAGED